MISGFRDTAVQNPQPSIGKPTRDRGSHHIHGTFKWFAGPVNTGAGQLSDAQRGAHLTITSVKCLFRVVSAYVSCSNGETMAKAVCGGGY